MKERELDSSLELLWAGDTYSVLIILQGTDTSGKDGTIRHVMSGVNPGGCRVTGFRVPGIQEPDHDFLRRYWCHLPARGEIGVFNRSYYEVVLVVEVHPDLIERQRFPDVKRNEKFWKDRYEDICAFERHQGPERDGDTQILPAHLEGGAEEAAARTPRDRGETVEVFGLGSRGAAPPGCIHRGPRGDARRHQYRRGTPVRDPRGPQVGGTDADLNDHPLSRPALPGGNG